MNWAFFFIGWCALQRPPERVMDAMFEYFRVIAIGSLILSLTGPFTAAAQGVEPAIVQDMQKKGADCMAVSPMTKAAQLCAVNCARAAQQVSGSHGMDAEQIAHKQTACDTVYVKAGFTLGAAPVPIAAPTLDARIAAMPNKSAYCIAQQTALRCSFELPGNNDYADETGPCYSARMCESDCGESATVSAGLAGENNKRANKTLANCEQAYDRLRILVAE